MKSPPLFTAPRPSILSVMRCVELFAGAGGLALGVSRAGFEPVAVVERDRYACDTVRHNQSLGVQPVVSWPLVQSDVRDLRYEDLGPVDLVTGGPPCQPFSLGGKAGAYDDHRDMFSEAVRAVRELRPRAFVFENVKGLTRTAFANYFEYIRLQLRFPDHVRLVGESWEDHHESLERRATAGGNYGVEYNVVTRLLNAADYGVPQRRERVFFVGLRKDLGLEYSFPSPTHAFAALLHDQTVSGDYWERHGIRAELDVPHNGLGLETPPHDLLPWRTVRDAISDLPNPERDPVRAALVPNHVFQPGARSYAGHTGSPLDLPAKTLKAGDHGVPGGENMILRPDGSVRYFTVRESARLQTFPDEFVFHGTWTETMRQLGNAVPVDLANVVVGGLRNLLEQSARA